MISSGCVSTPGSASAFRLCHICGIAYSKASLPAHQKSCIRKSLGTIQTTRSMTALSAGSVSFYPCTSCMTKIPQFKLAQHLRTCKGVSLSKSPAAQIYHEEPCRGSNEKNCAPASAPVYRGGYLNNTVFNENHGFSRGDDGTEMHSSDQGYQQNRDMHRSNSSQNQSNQQFIHPSTLNTNKKHTSLDYDSATQFVGDRIVSPNQTALSYPLTPLHAHSPMKEAIPSFSTKPIEQHQPSIRVVPKRSMREIPITSTLSVMPDTSHTPTHISALQKSASTTPTWDDKSLSRHRDPISDTHQSISTSMHPKSYNKEYQVASPAHGEFSSGAEMIQEELVEEYATLPLNMAPCRICNRKFLAERMEKHIIACMKSHQSRKVFNASDSRIKGTELEKYASKQHNQPSNDLAEKKLPKKSNWRIKHDAFVQMVRSARQPVDGTSSTTNQPKIDPNPDYVTCPSCNRRFNEDSGARHMPLCKEKTDKANRQAMAQVRNSSVKSGGVGNGRSGSLSTPATANREDMLKRRTAYKPPTPKTAKSAGKK
ncbi:hypothetical protein QVD99_006122 [Batrachochytrium dendrobatidis]|nr:hypothetical protein QVD99_006122 [Batrachochytrium dendrobatidis]